jgi:integral membrane protein (TIGR01906 family)
MADPTPTPTGAPAEGLMYAPWLLALTRTVIIAVLPLVLVLVNARLLMSDAFLRWEYNRPGFPADSYGFSQGDRLIHARRALGYLFNSEPISYLGDQTFPDGEPLYNERELSHMADVKQVTRQIEFFGYGLLLLWGVCVVVLAARPSARPVLYASLAGGAVLTVGLIVVGLIAVATSFRALFTGFHALFFEGDSWIFLTSDTLIRLFPEQFWVDAFAFMFGGALVEAIVIGVGAWLLGRGIR